MTEKIQVTMHYTQSTDLAAVVSRVAQGLYRFELDPLSCLTAESEEELETLPQYGDVVEAEELGPRTLRFVRVVERARWRRFEFLLAWDGSVSDAIKEVLSKVEQHKGHWERVFGGLVLIFLPVDTEYDPARDLERRRNA